MRDQPPSPRSARPARPARRPLRLASTGGPGLLGAAWLVACAACSPYPAPRTSAPRTMVGGEVTLIAPRCVGASACVVGHVTEAESGAPLTQAAIFLAPTGAPAGAPAGGEPAAPTIFALTDAQGVFTVTDPPPGSYRLAVYARSRHTEVRGLQVAEHGTTLVPIRLRP